MCSRRSRDQLACVGKRLAEREDPGTDSHPHLPPTLFAHFLTRKSKLAIVSVVISSKRPRAGIPLPGETKSVPMTALLQ